MKELFARYEEVLADREFLLATLIGVVLFCAGLYVNFLAVSYAAKSASAGTSDILLDNLPVVNTDLIFSEGALIFVLLVTLFTLIRPKTIPFTLQSIALFVAIRSVFVVMTHYGPYVEQIATDYNALRYISSGADLFFSGHTGLPFLMALLYWGNAFLRRFFLFSSVLAAVAVLLGHLHYTIDVFSAFFITYGVYNIAIRAFPTGFRFFTSARPEERL